MEMLNDNSSLDQTPSAGTRVGLLKKHIPNSITLLNLFCGCCAVLNVFEGQYLPAFWFFLAAITADYFDGAVARMLRVHSELGKELDSLADVISFGLLPGSIYYMLLVQGLTGDIHFQGLHWQATPGFLVTLFSALRLAKFNLDNRQSDYFIGLPTPSGTIFATGLMLIAYFNSFGLAPLVTAPAFLYPCIILLSAVLLAELPMFNLKFKHLAWGGNEIKIIFAAVAFLLLFLLREAALSLIILLYISISIIFKVLNRPV